MTALCGLKSQCQPAETCSLSAMQPIGNLMAAAGAAACNLMLGLLLVEWHTVMLVRNFSLHAMQPIGSLVSGAGAAACDLMTALCSWDPAKRPTAAQALQHPFFQVQMLCPDVWRNATAHSLTVQQGVATTYKCSRCALQASAR